MSTTQFKSKTYIYILFSLDALLLCQMINIGKWGSPDGGLSSAGQHSLLLPDVSLHGVGKTTTSSTCPSDFGFGPLVSGCRDDSDFTLLFEEIMFSIVPSACFLVLAFHQALFLRKQVGKPGKSLLELSKIVCYPLPLPHMWGKIIIIIIIIIISYTHIL